MVSDRTALARLGFTTIRTFQRAWNLGPALVADGINGPKTTAALGVSLRRHDAGLPDLSPHFSGRELACRCGGRHPGCARTLVLRELLTSLEQLRLHTGPLTIVSGYRCPIHNDSVGGAASSQHLFGAAADVPALLGVDKVRSLGVFAGIGYKGDQRRVCHVDRRDRSGHNTTSSTLRAPALWAY